MSDCDAAPASDRLLLGLARAPLQQGLKLGIAQLLDRLPWWCAPRADPVVREGFAQPLSGEFALPLKDPATTKDRVPRLGYPLRYLVHLMLVPVLGALPFLLGCAKLAILDQPLPEPSLTFGLQQ